MSAPGTERSLTLVIVAASLLFVACGELASGDLETETRSVESFDSLDIRDGVNVELTIDEGAEPSVSVTYDDNLLDNVVTRVSGDTLVIEFDGAITMLGGIGRVVSVVVDAIDRIEVSGGAEVTASGIASGYTIDASGGADADLSNLEVPAVEVDVSGGADVVVFATDLVEGEVSGGANLRVQGGPERVLVDTSGGADLDIDE